MELPPALDYGRHAFIRRIALGLRRHVADKVIVRLDAGTVSGELCSKLESDVRRSSIAWAT